MINQRDEHDWRWLHDIFDIIKQISLHGSSWQVGKGVTEIMPA